MADDDESGTETTTDGQESTTKAPSKRAAGKKTPSKKAPTKKTPGRKAPAKRQSRQAPTKRAAAAKAEPPRRPRAGAVAREAAAQLYELTGQEIEGITAVHRDDDGWVVEIDVLELRRIPATTDVLATYEVEVDENGDLMGYRRRHRFTRGSVSEDR